MTNVSPNYASKLAVAHELARLGARAVTITSVARTKPADSRLTFKRVHGSQSQSGQTPTDHEWFLANRTRRLHAAFLLITYAKYRLSLEHSPDAHGLAFAVALRNYGDLCGSGAPVSPERLNLLVGTGFGIGWRDIIKGGSSKFSSDNVRVLNCRKCRVPHLVEDFYVNYICTACS
jgi:hypothetical protein